MLTVDPQAPGSDEASGDSSAVADGVDAPAVRDAAATLADSRYRCRRRPCGGGPWRVDRLGAFPPAALRRLASTADDMSRESFVCHESSEAAPLVCAGVLLRGVEHNLAVRLRRSEVDRAVLHDGGHALHASCRDMAVAHGVGPDDSALAACPDGGVGRGRRPLRPRGA